MANVIDSLIVTLGLDTSAFTKASKEAEKDLDKTKKKGEESGEAFKKLAKGAAIFFSILETAHAVKKFVTDVTESNAQLELMSKNLNVAVGDLQAWGNIAAQAGGSAAGLQGTMDMLSKSMTEMQLTGESGILPYMRALGINMADASGHARPLTEMLTSLADRFSKMDRTEANNIGRMMGIDQGTMNLLLQGKGAIDEMLKRQGQMSLLTKEQGERSLKLKAAWTEMAQAMAAGGNQLVAAVTPALESVFRWLTSIFEWSEQHPALMESILIAVGTALAVVLVPALAVLVPTLWAATTAALAFAAALLLNPITWVILAIGAAIALLYDDWQTFKNGGKSFIDWASWGAGLDTAKKAIDDLRDSVGKLIDKMTSWFALKFPKTTAAIKAAAKAAAPALKAAAKAAAKMIINPIGGAADMASWIGGIVSKGEGGYNSVNLGAAHGYKASSVDLGSMTVAEVMAAQKAHQFNAAGRYQIIGPTLQSAASALKLTGKEKFDQSTQDRIFSQYLVGIKRKAISDYVLGKSNDARAAQIAGAQEWASIADPRTGKSFYAGKANNKATTTAADFLASLNRARVSNAALMGSGGSTTTTDVNIGTMNIHTQATDAQGIARDMVGAIKNNGLVNQADNGVS